MRLKVLVAPKEIQELEGEIEQLNAEKVEAIKAEAYEKAGEIKKLQQEKREKIEEINTRWEEEKNSSCPVVGEEERCV